MPPKPAAAEADVAAAAAAGTPAPAPATADTEPAPAPAPATADTEPAPADTDAPAPATAGTPAPAPVYDNYEILNSNYSYFTDNNASIQNFMSSASEIYYDKIINNKDNAFDSNIISNIDDNTLKLAYDRYKLIAGKYSETSDSETYVAGVELTTKGNSGVPADSTGYSQQCFWISFVDGLKKLGFDSNADFPDFKNFEYTHPGKYKYETDDLTTFEGLRGLADYLNKSDPDKYKVNNKNTQIYIEPPINIEGFTDINKDNARNTVKKILDIIYDITHIHISLIFYGGNSLLLDNKGDAYNIKPSDSFRPLSGSPYTEFKQYIHIKNFGPHFECILDYNEGSKNHLIELKDKFISIFFNLVKDDGDDDLNLTDKQETQIYNQKKKKNKRFIKFYKK